MADARFDWLSMPSGTKDRWRFDGILIGRLEDRIGADRAHCSPAEDHVPGVWRPVSVLAPLAELAVELVQDCLPSLWGLASTVANRLIAHSDEPILADPDAGIRLLADLRAISDEVRAAVSAGDDPPVPRTVRSLVHSLFRRNSPAESSRMAAKPTGWFRLDPDTLWRLRDVFEFQLGDGMAPVILEAGTCLRMVAEWPALDRNGTLEYFGALDGTAFVVEDGPLAGRVVVEFHPWIDIPVPIDGLSPSTNIHRGRRIWDHLPRTWPPGS
jgi:hypothetical protein